MKRATTAVDTGLSSLTCHSRGSDVPPERHFFSLCRNVKLGLGVLGLPKAYRMVRPEAKTLSSVIWMLVKEREKNESLPAC